MSACRPPCLHRPPLPYWRFRSCPDARKTRHAEPEYLSQRLPAQRFIAVWDLRNTDHRLGIPICSATTVHKCQNSGAKEPGICIACFELGRSSNSMQRGSTLRWCPKRPLSCDVPRAPSLQTLYYDGCLAVQTDTGQVLGLSMLGVWERAEVAVLFQVR